MFNKDSKNYYWIFDLDCSVISELEVKCEDLEWERDIYLDCLVRGWVDTAKNALK